MEIFERGFEVSVFEEFNEEIGKKSKGGERREEEAERPGENLLTLESRSLLLPVGQLAVRLQNKCNTQPGRDSLIKDPE